MAFEDFARALGDSTVAGKIRGHKHCFWTQPLGSYSRHRGANPKTPRFVGSSADNRAVTLPGDNDRLAPQAGVVALLDRGIERVHINVDYLARVHPSYVIGDSSWRMLSAYRNETWCSHFFAVESLKI